MAEVENSGGQPVLGFYVSFATISVKQLITGERNPELTEGRVPLSTIDPASTSTSNQVGEIDRADSPGPTGWA